MEGWVGKSFDEDEDDEYWFNDDGEDEDDEDDEEGEDYEEDVDYEEDEEEDMKDEVFARDFFAGRRDDDVINVPFKRESFVGRNDPCPCGSGKKYKKCCLGKTQEG